MPALEQPGGEVRVHYRFIMPCPSEQPWIAETGTCGGNAWLHRPKIDWSDCNSKLPLIRYVCFPREKCEGDEVRSPSNDHGDLDWLYIGPTVQRIGGKNRTEIKCEYEDMDLLNPWGLIPIDMDGELLILM
ncbi:unnamed protein product [Dibothriocephalus latus]|uniref:Uncharacterized protein n=1 Tax=Dibothriocephalus latus TaxID=60516 RepID=A0A3P7NSV0_DIBLA|nr:unnamed protein product [Dibothriocephalus latus]